MSPLFFIKGDEHLAGRGKNRMKQLTDGLKAPFSWWREIWRDGKLMGPTPGEMNGWPPHV